MANLKASKKDILVNRRNYNRNKNLKTSLKTVLKVAYASLETFNEETQKVVYGACRLVDKMTTKGIIKKTTGARKKSRLMKAMNVASVSASKK